MIHRVSWCVAALAVVAIVACKKNEALAKDAKPAPDGTSFTGSYQSNWGPTAFTQNGSNVTASYSRGTMACQATGSTLDCTWQEGLTSGKAKLTKMTDGSIRGTWGTGTSATNGGNWTFTP